MGALGRSTICIGECSIDLEQRRVCSASGDLPLTSTEAALLGVLSQRSGQIVGRDELHRLVWGHVGSCAGRAVDHAVKRLRKKLGVSNLLETVRGAGYRLNLSLSPQNAPEEPPTSFFGRAEELAQIARAFERVSTVGLWGGAGTGKTRLALRYTSETRERYPGGIVWIPLGGSPLTIKERVAETLGTTASAPLSRIPRDSPALVILDDSEDTDELSVLIAQWTRAAPQVRFLLSGRGQLEKAARECIEIRPLPDPFAIRLFLDRSSSSGAALDPSDRSIRALVERLDSTPAALELAATWMGVLSPAQLLSELPDTVGAALDAAFSTSFVRLERWAADALVQLCSFETFTFASASAVLDLSRHPHAPPTADVIRHLRRAAWLSTRNLINGSIELSLLRTAQDFLSRNGDPYGSLAPARERHRRFFLESDLRGEDLRWARGNLDLIAADRDAPPAHRAAAALRAHRARPPGSEEETSAVVRLDRALADALAGDAPTSLLVSIRSALAGCRRRLGDLYGAESELRGMLAQSVLSLAEEISLLGALAGVLRDRGLLSDASAITLRALGSSEHLPDGDIERRRILSMAGAIALQEDRYDDAEVLFRRFIAEASVYGDAEDLAKGRLNLGTVHLNRGRFEEANIELSTAARLREGKTATLTDVHLRWMLSLASMHAGDLHAAAEHAREGLATAHRAGWAVHGAKLLAQLGAIQMYASDPDARETLSQALAAYRRAGMTPHEVLANLGCVAWRAGALEEALDRLLEAEGCAPSADLVGYQHLRATILAICGRGDEAEALCQPLHEGASEIEQALLALARLAVDRSHRRPVEIPPQVRRAARSYALLRMVLGQLDSLEGC